MEFLKDPRDIITLRINAFVAYAILLVFALCIAGVILFLSQKFANAYEKVLIARQQQIESAIRY